MFTAAGSVHDAARDVRVRSPAVLTRAEEALPEVADPSLALVSAGLASPGADATPALPVSSVFHAFPDELDDYVHYFDRPSRRRLPADRRVG